MAWDLVKRRTLPYLYLDILLDQSLMHGTSLLVTEIWFNNNTSQTRSFRKSCWKI